MKNLKSFFIYFFLLAFYIAGFAYAKGPNHTEGGVVLNAIDGTPANGSFWRLWRHGRLVSGSFDGSGGGSRDITSGYAGQERVGAMFSGFWFGQVGDSLKTPWQIGDNHIVVIDKEEQGGSINHKGYYAVTDKYITGASPDMYEQCQLRLISVPIASSGEKYIDVSWTVAIEDPRTSGNQQAENIAGYNLYRSSDGISGWEKINSSPITTKNNTRYRDTGVKKGGKYYYALKLLYRGAPDLIESIYLSGNSNPVSPEVGEAIPVGTLSGEEFKAMSASTGIVNKGYEYFVVYPNPTSGERIIFGFPNSENKIVKVRIYNMVGKEIVSLEGKGVEIVWELKGIAEGVYVAVAEKEGARIGMKKIVILNN